MKIVVLGSGAMGCVYGGKLAEAGYEVTLVDMDCTLRGLVEKER